MSTFRDLQDRIALDYLNRTDLMPEIRRAINNAIRTYEPRRYWFCETSTALTTSAGQSNVAIPSDFFSIDRMEISYSGSWSKLAFRAFDTIRIMNASSATSVPTHYAYRGDRFELALIPDSAYTVMCYYLQKLPALSADTDSNAWTNEGANLITHAAVLDVLGCGVVTANQMKLAFHTEQLRRAEAEMAMRNEVRTGMRIKATRF